MSVELALKISQYAGFDALDADELANANIMPKTGLATDYLNVFNEAVMLFGLLGDMPDMIEELELWEPLSYEEHFSRSNFHAKELAIAVYKLIPEERKTPFDIKSNELGLMTQDAIEEAKNIIANDGDIAEFAQETCFAMQSMIMLLDSMIHGKDLLSAQDNIDALFD